MFGFFGVETLLQTASPQASTQTPNHEIGRRNAPNSNPTPDAPSPRPKKSPLPLPFVTSHSAAVGRLERARSRGKRGQLRMVYALLPESQGHNLALAVLYVPCSLDSGARKRAAKVFHCLVVQNTVGPLRCLATENRGPVFRFINSIFFVFFINLVTGPIRSLGLKLSDTRVYEPQIRARLGTTSTTS